MAETVEPRERVAEHFAVLRAQLGDRDAYGELFRQYNARLLYYLRRLLPVATEAEDTLQEVWVTVVRKLPSLEQPEAFKGWIYRVARNRALSRLRRSRREIAIDQVEAEVDGNLDSAATDERALLRLFEAQLVHRGLEELSPSHREVLTLRFVDELTYDEIAEIVGRSIGTVRSRLYYAKKTLSRYLEEKQDE